MTQEFDFDTVIEKAGTGNVKFDARKGYFGTEDVQPLWVADMDFAAPEAVTQALINRAQHPVYGYHLYPDSMYQAMQDWFVKRHQWSIERKHIVMCPGVVPSLQACVDALTEVGDSVLIQTPVYHPFFSVIEKSQRKLVENRLKRVGDHYEMDLEHLASCFQQGVKLMVFCSPHNPVGRVWTESELQSLIELAKQYDVTIISDEIHADLIYPGFKHIPLQLLADGVNVITTVSATKTFNIAGLNISTMVVPDATTRKAVNKVFSRWHISASNPFSITAFEAAYREGEAWLDALMQYLAESKQAVTTFIKQYIPQIEVIATQGTYLLWLDCRKLELDDDNLRQLFIEQAKVGLNPGYTFGETGSGYMRMNIAAPREQILFALQKIADACEKR